MECFDYFVVDCQNYKSIACIDLCVYSNNNKFENVFKYLKDLPISELTLDVVLPFPLCTLT